MSKAAQPSAVDISHIKLGRTARGNVAALLYTGTSTETQQLSAVMSNTIHARNILPGAAHQVRPFSANAAVQQRFGARPMLST